MLKRYARASALIVTAISAAAILATPAASAATLRNPEGGPVISGNITWTAAPAGRWYVVRRGDDLFGIARRLDGSGGWWPQLWAQNRKIIPDALAIPVGARLWIGPKWRHMPGVPERFEPKPAPPAPAPAAAPAAVSVAPAPAAPAPAAPPALDSNGGVVSYAGLEQLWIGAGGPAGVAAEAATIAECESGGDPAAYNPSGASGLWEILGTPFPGNPFDPGTNAAMAVAKYNGAGGNFSPWVC